MTRGDGDGWSRGPDGARRWGRFGAAGLLLRAPSAAGAEGAGDTASTEGTVGIEDAAVLLQHRAFWSHHGGTWGLPGGARDSHESATQTALREAVEETGIRAADVVVRAERLTSRVSQGWSYTTVVADARVRLPTQRNGESAELRWVPERDVDALALHPGFAASWPHLRARPMRLLLGSEEPSRAAACRSAFPRTLALPSGDFAWVATAEAGVDFATLAAPEECIVVTTDHGLRTPLPQGVHSVDPSILLS